MRLSLVLVGSVIFATACTFGDADVKKPATDDPYAERTKPTKSGELNEQTLKSGSLVSLSCGPISCDVGVACCVTANGPSCTNKCDAGKSFECSSAKDCGGGQVCCLEGNTATCASSCNGLRVCNDGNECGAGSTCTPNRCEGRSAGYEFGICRGEGTEGRQVGCPESTDTGVASRDGTDPAAPDPGPTPMP